MAWSKCYKNCVITGPLDAFCLVCECHLKSEDDLDAHLLKPIHKKNLESSNYSEKYKDDNIRKVKKGYYCEFCNLLLFTPAKVGLHIAEPEHRHQRGTQLLNRVNNTVTAFNEIILGDRPWNGFVEDTCAICNTEIENENTHKTDYNHIVNLILKKIEFEDKLIYRKIDDSSYQCLTCNLVLASSTLLTHVNQTDHLKKWDVCRSFSERLVIQNDIRESTTKMDNSDVPSKTDTIDKTDAKESKDLKKENTIMEAVTTEQTSQVNTVKANVSKDDKKEFKKNEEACRKPPKGSPRELEENICNILGAKNYIVLVDNGKSMCLLCDWFMDTKVAAAHVGGRHHQTILKMHKQRLDKMANDYIEINPSVNDHKLKAENGSQKIKVDEKPIVTSNADDDKNKILDCLSVFQNNNININFECGSVVCKKCGQTLTMEFDAISKHIEEHENFFKKIEAKPDGVKKSEEKKPVNIRTALPKLNEDGCSSRASSNTSDDEQIEAFVKENDLSYKGGKIYCSLCVVYLPISLKNLKEHVIGAQHSGKLVKKNGTPNSKNEKTSTDLSTSTALTMISSEEYITSMVALENTIIKDVIINEKFSISLMSFLMITSENHNNMVKCQVCEIVFRAGDMSQHKTTSCQRRAVSDIPVVTSIDDEFIREVRPGVFYCGFCADVTNGWEDFEDHLRTRSHGEKKTAASWRLREHLAAVRLHDSGALGFDSRNMLIIARERWQRASGIMACLERITGGASGDAWQ